LLVREENALRFLTKKKYKNEIEIFTSIANKFNDKKN
jgi:hypothetical protein